MGLNVDSGFDITLDLTTVTKEEGEKSLLSHIQQQWKLFYF